MLIDTNKQIGLKQFIEVMRSLTAQDFQYVTNEVNVILNSKQENNGDTVNVYDFDVQDMLNVVDNIESDYNHD